jgi:hypothetical protein
VAGLQELALGAGEVGAGAMENLLMVEWPGLFVAGGLHVVGQLDEGLHDVCPLLD